jgi:hypothetical protein
MRMVDCLLSWILLCISGSGSSLRPATFSPHCPSSSFTPASFGDSSSLPGSCSGSTSSWFSSHQAPRLDIKDAKGYLDHHELIQYYLRLPDYSTKCSDSLLITNASNLCASHFWEGLIHAAVKDGSLHLLFDNKGTLYHGKGFEMHEALDQHCCCPDTVTNAFTTLMSLFNDVQGKSEPIVDFQFWFDSMVMYMLRCRIMLPKILLVMLFLRALHARYTDLLDQFCSLFKVLEDASLASVVKDVRYHDSFTRAGPKKSPPPPASTSNVNKQGNKWANPFGWLSKYGRRASRLDGPALLRVQESA